MQINLQRQMSSGLGKAWAGVRDYNGQITNEEISEGDAYVSNVSYMTILCLFEDKRKAIARGRYQGLKSMQKSFLFIDRRLPGRQMTSFLLLQDKPPANKVFYYTYGFYG